jgi:hypothetical protein
MLAQFVGFIRIPSFCHCVPTQDILCREIGCLTTFYTWTKLRRSSLSPLIPDGIIALLSNFEEVSISASGGDTIRILTPSETGVIYHNQPPTNFTNQWRTTICFLNSQSGRLEDLNPPWDHLELSTIMPDKYSPRNQSPSTTFPSYTFG